MPNRRTRYERAATFAAIAASGLIAAAALIVHSGPSHAAPPSASQIDYQGFAELTGSVEAYRAERLVPIDVFMAMAREPGVILLDARSAEAFAMGHIEGAVNLPFSDFTEEKLAVVLGSKDATILIYCNNNFSNDAAPVMLKRAPLALNIPTFINLVGYGYENVFELADVVDMNEPVLAWTGLEEPLGT